VKVGTYAEASYLQFPHKLVKHYMGSLHS